MKGVANKTSLSSKVSRKPRPSNASLVFIPELVSVFRIPAQLGAQKWARIRISGFGCPFTR